LKELNCSNNKITELRLGECANLESLDCSSNKLFELDLKKLSNLKKINCSDNIKLDITEQNHLEEVVANKELLEKNEFLKGLFVFYSGSNKYVKKHDAQQ